MPGEEGYPTYLASRLASFYERAGTAQCLGPDLSGSVTIVGAVSPPGGDFSEPVTQSTMRVTGALWALDSPLAHRRHYPAINWNRSYTLYFERLSDWYRQHVGPAWPDNRARLMETLQKEAELQEVVQLVGPDALQESDRLLLEVSRMLREGFLQQNAVSETDATCSLEKQHGMLTLLLDFLDMAKEAVAKHVPLPSILALPEREELARLREASEADFSRVSNDVEGRLKRAIDSLAKENQS